MEMSLLECLFSLIVLCFIADISQVQCIKSYQAQEHDELTLEKADILHAKTITSDGKSLEFLESVLDTVPCKSTHSIEFLFHILSYKNQTSLRDFYDLITNQQIIVSR